eukprot:2088843-Rhodomonas_salina.2
MACVATRKVGCQPEHRASAPRIASASRAAHAEKACLERHLRDAGSGTREVSAGQCVEGAGKRRNAHLRVLSLGGKVTLTLLARTKFAESTVTRQPLGSALSTT